MTCGPVTGWNNRIVVFCQFRSQFKLVYFCRRPFSKFRAFFDGYKTDSRGVLSYSKYLRNLRLGNPFCNGQKTLEIFQFRFLSELTKYGDSTIGRASFLPKQFPKICAFLVLFPGDYLCNHIFGFVSAFKP